MNYDERIKEYLKLYNFTELTEVQKMVIPKALSKKNIVVESVTGTGKTHAFLFPLFLLIDKSVNDLQAVISSPTRELARQIYEMAKPLAEYEGVTIKLYAGGDDINKSISSVVNNLGNGRLRFGNSRFFVGFVVIIFSNIKNL